MIMHKIGLILCMSFCLVQTSFAEGSDKAGTSESLKKILEINFNDQKQQGQMTKIISEAALEKVNAELVKEEGRGTVLKITAKEPGRSMIRIPFEVGQYRGQELVFRCEAKADNVSKPNKEWLGIKFMLGYETGSGSKYPQQFNVNGTFDWKSLSFTHKIAEDSGFDGGIYLGLQSSSGTVWFDKVEVLVKDISESKKKNE